MHQVLKFPLRHVQRSATKKTDKTKNAEILFFTGVRYERHEKEEIERQSINVEAAENG